MEIVYNVLTENIPVSEEVRTKLRSHKDILVNLAQRNVPYKTEKRALVQEGSGFIQEWLIPAISRKGTLDTQVWSFVSPFKRVLVDMKRKMDWDKEEESGMEDNSTLDEESDDEEPRIKDVLNNLSSDVSEKACF